MAIAHTSKITFKVDLDENKVPEEISWIWICGPKTCL